MIHENCTYIYSDVLHLISNDICDASLYDENDILTLIKNNDEELISNNYYYEIALTTLNYALVATNYIYFAYVLKVSPISIMAPVIGLEILNNKFPSDVVSFIHETFKIPLNICIMNHQYNFFNDNNFFEFSAFKATHYVLSLPLNLMYIENFINIGKKVLEVTLTPFENDMISNEHNNNSSEKSKLILESSLKRFVKYTAKQFSLPPLYQSMIGDYFKNTYTNYYNAHNHSPQNKEVLHSFKNNFIKYEICYQVFPDHVKSYHDGIGMHICRTTINNVKLNDFCDMLFDKQDKHNFSISKINLMCNKLITPVANTIKLFFEKNFF